jgi:hypothetical protein
MKHKTFAKAGMAALALSFFMMIALTGCELDADSSSAGIDEESAKLVTVGHSASYTMSHVSFLSFFF